MSGTVMIYLTNMDSPLTQKVTKNYIIRGPHFYNLMATFKLSKKEKKSFLKVLLRLNILPNV